MRARLPLTVLIITLLSAGKVVGAEQKQEPRGVRLRTSTEKGREPILIPWGATADEIAVMSARKDEWPGFAGHLHCDNKTEGTCRFSSTLIAWHTDFGENASFPPPHIHLHHGQFYEYALPLDADDFDFVRGVLIKALGSPSSSHEYPRQNAFGATFTGRLITWNGATVEVRLSASISRIDDGAMIVTYKPLAPPEQKVESKAPF